jgi:cytochrome c553
MGTARCDKNLRKLPWPGWQRTTVLTPRLNGQLSAYIVHRLYELDNLTPNSPHAMAIYDIAHISDSDKTAAANYLSYQTPTAAQPQAGKLGEMGQKLNANGDPTNNLPACQSCHGANAEGQREVPHFAGLHREYLKTQLWGLNFGLHANSIMGPSAMNLSSDQIDALVAYLGAD